jgi:hypothetical protein
MTIEVLVSGQRWLDRITPDSVRKRPVGIKPGQRANGSMVTAE